MAKPIDHSFGSATATTAWSAVKGGLVGTLAIMAVGAVGGALVLGLGAAAVAGLVTSLPFMAGGASVAAVGWIAAGIGALVGGVGILPAAGVALPAVMGGSAILGAASGANKVSAEKSAFRGKVAHGTAATAAMQQGYAIGAQDGLQQGFQKGQEYVIGQLRQLQESQLMQDALQAKGGHAAKVCKDREAQAVAGSKQL